MSFQNIEESLKNLDEALTPFRANKSATQQTTFSIDPSKGLTKKRYGWYSDGDRFDNSYFSELQGGIEIETSSTADDTARIRSAVPGDYKSHTLGVPGIGFNIEPGSIQIDNNGLVSTDGGLVAIGGGWFDETNGTGWSVDSVNGTIRTFFGFKIDENSSEAVLISQGEHQADSPVPQENWNIDTMDGSGDNNNPSGMEFRPDNGHVWNGPYTWYNQGALVIGFVDKTRNKFIPAHQFEVEGVPSIGRPNLPTTIIVDNDGTATPTKAKLGGMQYSRYGEGRQIADLRITDVGRETSGGYISDPVTIDANNSVNPRDEPGKPIISVKKNQKLNDIAAQVDRISIDTDNDVYVFVWDEYDAPNALTNQNFRKPSGIDTGETKMQVDTEANAYTPQTALMRGWVKLTAGQTVTEVSGERVTDRIPIGATRVYTAVHDGTAADANPFKIEVQESY